MSDVDSCSLKRSAEEAGFHNHDTVQNQAVTQTNHGPLYLGNVNIYNGAPVASPSGNSDLISEVKEGILKSLAFPHMLDRRNDIAQPHPHTCEWIFGLAEYLSWIDSPHGLLWIKGKPGSGKSTLMAFMHQKLSEQAQGKDEIHLDFFFTARATELQRSPVGMLQSLLYQLLRQCPNVGSAVATSYREKCNAYGQTNWKWQQSELERFLADAVLAAAQHQQVVIFVDALDEAGEQAARHVARYIHSINDRVAANATNHFEGRLKVCFSSRHYPITSTAKGLEICVEHHNQVDIETFIHDELRLDPSESDETTDIEDWIKLKHEIFDQAKGGFQWVRLVLPILSRELNEGWSPENARKFLKKLPQDLENIYTHILQNVLNRQHISQSLLLFQWVCFALEPVSTIEMMYALISDKPISRSLRLIFSEKVMKKRINSLSGGLIEVLPRPLRGGIAQPHTVQVIHQTVKEYFMNNGLKLLFHLAGDHETLLHSHLEHDQTTFILKSHSALYWCCLNYLASLDLDMTVPIVARNRHATSRYRDDKVACDLRSSLPLAWYATRHIFKHAQQSCEYRCPKESQAVDLQQELELLQQIWRCWVACNRILINPPHFLTYRPVTLCENWSILHLSAVLGLRDVVQHLANDEGAINQPDDNGFTPFGLALLAGHQTVCKMLFQRGADIYTAGDKNIVSPLVCAVTGGNVELVVWLLELNAPINPRSYGDTSPLYAAASQTDTTILKVLLNAGADVNARSGSFGCALHAAVEASHGDEEAIQMLLDAGADVNAQGGEYGTALQTAIACISSRWFKGGLVQLFLRAGADVNLQGGKLGSALNAARVYCYEEIAQMLVKAGATELPPGHPALDVDVDVNHVVMERVAQLMEDRREILRNFHNSN